MRIEALAGVANSLPRVSRLLAFLRSFYLRAINIIYKDKKTQMLFSIMGFNYSLDKHIHLGIK